MDALKTLYPGVIFPEDWNSFLDNSEKREFKSIIQNHINLVRKQYPAGDVFSEFADIDPEKILDYFRKEQYFVQDSETTLLNSLRKNIYYFFRPLISVGIRSKIQRFSLRKWRDISFPQWPVDTTADDLAEFFLRKAIEKRENNNSFVWFWPGAYSSCLLLTHDVETLAGWDNCRILMDLEEKYGFRSSFEIIPEKRYQVDKSLLNEMENRGFEVCVHGFNHDGNLFTSREVFNSRKEKIKIFAESCGAKGFRSPVMYRNPEWIDELDFSYDMSFPNVGHLDPQRGGCCTVFPFFNGKTLEVPLTTIQDYSLIHVLNLYDIDLWKEQLGIITSKHGLVSFIIHPDYMLDQKSLDLYEKLLVYLSQQKNMWFANPGELCDWWRARAHISNQKDVESLGKNTRYNWKPSMRDIIFTHEGHIEFGAL